MSELIDNVVVTAVVFLFRFALAIILVTCALVPLACALLIGAIRRK